jgi:hypothetical protein
MLEVEVIGGGEGHGRGDEWRVTDDKLKAGGGNAAATAAGWLV